MIPDRKSEVPESFTEPRERIRETKDIYQNKSDGYAGTDIMTVIDFLKKRQYTFHIDLPTNIKYPIAKASSIQITSIKILFPILFIIRKSPKENYLSE